MSGLNRSRCLRSSEAEIALSPIRTCQECYPKGNWTDNLTSTFPRNHGLDKSAEDAITIDETAEVYKNQLRKLQNGRTYGLSQKFA